MEMIREKVSTDALVIGSAIEAIAEEMGWVAWRSACSVTITASHDLSCTIFDNQLRQLAQPPHVPIHMGEFPAGVKSTIEALGGLENLRDGDMTICNDPYLGNVPHLPDIQFVSPVFYQGELMFVAATTAHNVDIGGSAPGTFAWGSTDIFGDGLRIPPLKLYEEGKLVPQILDILFANVRAPTDQKKDFYAQMAANEYAKKTLIKLLDKYGKDRVKRSINEYLSYSEGRMRAEIENMPDGTFSGEVYLEGDGVTDEIINYTVAITIKGDNIHFDWTGSHPQVPGPINMPSCRTIGSAFVALAMFIDPDVPQNYGRLAPATFTLPEETVVNCTYPYATTCTHEAVGRAISACIMALTKAMPEKGYGQDGWSNMDLGYGGYCERTKRRFAHMHFGVHGYGARATKDGLDAKSNLHGGRIANAPDEILESRSSLRILKFTLIQDSGGPGKFRGGLGTELDLEYTGNEVSKLVLGGDKIKIPPKGVFGGKNGKGGKYIIVSGGKEYEPKIKSTHFAFKGDVLKTFHAGGGGYGDPLERDPEKVKEDLLDGYISQKSALGDYGVVVNIDTEKVDYESTKQLRDKLRQERETIDK